MAIAVPVSAQSGKQRKVYERPQLVVFGSVRVLTQSGSGATAEGVTRRGTCGSRLTRKPCSERRLKYNIRALGMHPWGFGLYLFEYLPELQQRFGRGPQFGIMIDEVEPLYPAAISVGQDGYKRVDLGLLGITSALPAHP